MRFQVGVCSQWRIQGGGTQQAPPLFSGKYFKKSPKLAKITKKILGASPQNPGRPPPLSSDPGSATDSEKNQLNQILYGRLSAKINLNMSDI